MKNLFSNRKIVFALGLIIGAGLMLIFTFAVPGRRTYIGKEDIGREVKIGQPEKVEDEMLVTKKIEEAEKEGVIPGKQTASVKPYGPQFFEQLIKAKKAEKQGELVKEITKSEPKEGPVIPDDTISAK